MDAQSAHNGDSESDHTLNQLPDSSPAELRAELQSNFCQSPPHLHPGKTEQLGDLSALLAGKPGVLQPFSRRAFQG